MSNSNKNRLNEYSDLEERLRQNRPSTSPMSPVTKRHLRAQLMENKQMNKSNPMMGHLNHALVVLVLVIGLPLFFWVVLSSINSQPQNTTAPEALATATSTIVVVENTATATAAPITTATEAATAVPTLPPTPLPQPSAKAEITAISKGVLIADPPDPFLENFRTISVTVEYALQGYDTGILVIQYLDGEDGVSSTETVIAATEGDQVTVDFIFAPDYFMDDGQLDPSIVFTTHINVYDDENKAFFNLYPGDIELLPFEMHAPPPVLPLDSVSLQALTLTKNEANAVELTLSINIELINGDEGTVTAVISSQGNVMAAETISVTQASLLLTLPLTFTPVSNDDALMVSLTLNVGEEVITKSSELTLADLATETANTVWIKDVIAEEEDNQLVITALVGYQLEAPYTGGMIEHRSTYTLPAPEGAANDSASGGGAVICSTFRSGKGVS